MYTAYQEQVVYKGDMVTGNLEEFIIPNFTLEHILGNRIGDVTQVVPYEYNGEHFLVVTWQEITSDDYWLFQTYIGLYNYNTGEWIYEKKIMNEPALNGVVLSPPHVYEGKFYANVGNNLVCHDITTGDQIWTRSFAQDFMFSGFIIAEGKIIANCEDGNTYGIDPINGNILWQTPSAGTSGHMSYLNGVIYFVGGSTGALHAIDVANGRMLWKIENENIGDSASFKTNAVYVFSASGNTPARVIALTHNNVYSFNAAR
jgi:outer membrane protein assembly factor BamB